MAKMRGKGLRLLAGALAGTLVLVLWGMIFWGFLAGPLGVFHKISNDRAVTQALEAGGITTGTYFMPWPRNTPETFAAFVAQHKSGPFYRLSIVREGTDPNSVRKIIVGCVHYFVVASIAVLLLLLTRQRTVWRRISTVLLAGMLGSVFITVADPIWFHMPWDYVRGELLYQVVAWLLLSVTASVIVGPIVAGHGQGF
jgi:hypothetical protein